MATIALDIGGTKIAAGLILDTDPVTVYHRHTRPTRADEGAQVVLGEILHAIADTEDYARTHNHSISRIGIGAPGVVGHGKILSAGSTMPGWAGTDLYTHIHNATGYPTAIHNDVRVMGLGEAIYGAGDFTEVLFVSIGTGIGGALITHGNLIDSPHFSRGEIAYLLGPTPSGGCAPIESVGSGPSMSHTYGAPSLHEVMADYRHGVDKAITLFDSAQHCVGQAIAGFVNAYDVDAVILGGGVGTLPETLKPFRAGFYSGLLDSLSDIPVNQATLGTNAPLVGAAHLARTTL
ncbi:MAG: ROK family protein [Corynebacterium sp.]|uniref:ROK family protein n=1 Tax=Corynebacterium sp. TaxID=1720 RepID=UPI0026DAFF44|nr:ROK family protein [Corynebacterium sp.]MDO4760951.1 ROK family protein [Corynebacterium sp.]